MDSFVTTDSPTTPSLLPQLPRVPLLTLLQQLLQTMLGEYLFFSTTPTRAQTISTVKQLVQSYTHARSLLASVSCLRCQRLLVDKQVCSRMNGWVAQVAPQLVAWGLHILITYTCRTSARPRQRRCAAMQQVADECCVPHGPCHLLRGNQLLSGSNRFNKLA